MPEDLYQLGRDLIRSLYLYEANEDKELYTFSRQQLYDEIVANRQNYYGCGGKDNGSDSDPLADELNMKEKLHSFISE